MMAGKLEGLTFVFTGTLSRFTREEAEKMVTDLGGEAASSVSKKTSYLVAGRNPESKLTQNAQSLGIPVLTEDEWFAMAGDTVKLYMKVKKESDWAAFQYLNPKEYYIPFTAKELFHGEEGTPTERQISFPAPWDRVCRFIEQCSWCSGRLGRSGRSGRLFAVACHMEDGDCCCTSKKTDRGDERSTLIRFKVPHPDSASLLNVQSIFKEAGVRLTETRRVYLAEFDGENFAFARKGMTIVDGVLIRDDTVMGCTGSVAGRVTIPDGVRRIRQYAFSGCHALEEIALPPSVTGIGEGAFSGCTALEKITLPPSVAEIGGYTFRGCTALKEITLPPFVTGIDESAFSGCSSLEKITLPPSVETIGWNAFSDCTALREIVLPPSVKIIGENAFQRCTALREICFPANVVIISMRLRGCDPLFLGCDSLEKIRLTGTPGASGKCLENLALPKSLRSIEAPDVPYTAFPTGLKTPALIGFIEACMRGEDVAEELKGAYFEAFRKRGRFSLYLDHPLIIRFLTGEKWIKLSQIDALTEESAKTGNAEVTAMLLDYKHSAFSEKEIQKGELRKQRKSEKELERILES